MSKAPKSKAVEEKVDVFFSPTLNLRFRAGRLEQLCLASQDGSPSWTEWREVDQVEDDAEAFGE